LIEGVRQAHLRGILTSASVVATSQCFAQAIELAKAEPRLGVGVHLVIDEYPPASPPEEIPSLLDRGGGFFSRAVSLARILLGRAKRNELRREWEAQVSRVVDAGVRPTHLDGHGHCHATPNLVGLVLEIAARFGIGAVRLPAEAMGYLGQLRRFSSRRFAEKLLISCACTRARAVWKGRLHFPNAFLGFSEAGRLDVSTLDRIAGSLGPGVSELMSHPGVSGDDRPYLLDYDWAGDLTALTRYSRDEFEERFSVRLVSYGDAWCDSIRGQS
jgi:hypothetical protein